MMPPERPPPLGFGKQAEAGAQPLPEKVLRLFVSSPGDVPDERRRVDLVVERLNTEFEGRVRIESIRWETAYYSAHDSFQGQIPEAADCDVVIAVFRARLGTKLPAGFPAMPSGEPYPSGTAYEVLSAIDARKRARSCRTSMCFATRTRLQWRSMRRTGLRSRRSGSA